MYRIYWKWFLASSALLMLNLYLNNAATIKMTNAVCTSYNKSWVVISQCRLKAVHRNKTILNVDMEVLHPANEIDMRLQIQKKGNGYKPWLFDISFDACKFMQRPNNPAVKAIYGIFKEFSTINHTCPYYGYNGVRGFYPNMNKFPIPFPTGDYVLNLTFIFSKQQTFDVNVYFTYVENLI